MSAPSTTDEFLGLVAKSDLFPAARLEEFVDRRRADRSLPATPMKTAQLLVFDGLLTKYQAEQLLSGRWRNFIIGGKYKLLERLGKGGMALVFLCEHQVMKRLVALKILPTAHGEDRELLGRFHREARALSSLRHPNIVGAYDADHANKVHFLVMEYVDGGDLDQIVQKIGPMPWERASEYIRQAALGLQHAHECGLVHRDIKPGNLLVDRSGTVKLLDLGLARIFHETTDDLTTGRDAKTLLGTVDYLAPEQALNSHDVDIRADIYGLGATFYYLLTGKGLFEDGTVAQKLSWHLHRPPVPISQVRPDVPEGLLEVIDRMLAKRPNDRFQVPEEVVEALEPWTTTPIAPPDPAELPQLSRAARRSAQPSSVRMNVGPTKAAPSSTTRRPDVLSRTTKILPGAVVEPPTPPPSTPPTPAPPTPKPKPSAPRIAPPSAVVAVGPKIPRPRWRDPRVVSALAAGVLLLSGLGGWALLGPSTEVEAGKSPTTIVGRPPGSVANPSKPAGLSPPPSINDPPADQAADASIALVSGSGGPRAFAGLREAIKASRAGDRVVVTGSLLVDSVDLSSVEGAPRDLTIEGVDGRSKGQPVRWRAGRDHAPGRPLLDVSGLEGFRLKGFLFDGQGRVGQLVRLSGKASGSTLEEVQFQGATRAGLVLRGWSGDSSRPSAIRKARFSTSTEAEAAIAFEPDPDRPGDASTSIRVTSCVFNGPYQSALLVAGPVENLDVEQCRFYRSTDGLRYRRADSRHPIRARVANNTFVDLQRAIHFETTPPADSSELVVTNNIFANTTRAATLDRVSVEPGKVVARWIWTEEGSKKTTVPPGSRQFRKSFDLASLPAQATLDIGCDETFAVWLNGVEVFRNPSPHFTQRVFAIDVTRSLRVGRNVLAIQGTNQLDRLDPRFGTTAGLLAQITTTQAGREVVLVKTDETWRSGEFAPEGWTRLDFDDQSWAMARRWNDEAATWPWKFAVWDSAVRPQLKAPLEPIKVVATGNVRDYKSWEGYPTLDSERVVLPEADLPKDPQDDPSFLHYPTRHALATAGPGGAPLGAFEER